MFQGLIWLLEWKARIAMGGYDKLAQLAPIEVIEQGVELLKNIEAGKLNVSHQALEGLQQLMDQLATPESLQHAQELLLSILPWIQ